MNSKPKSRFDLSPKQRELLAKLASTGLSDGPFGSLWTITRSERRGLAPASCSQQRLWFLNQMKLDSTAYNERFGLKISGLLDREALQSAINGTIARHEILRTSFHNYDGVVKQSVLPALEISISVDDLTGLAEDARSFMAAEIAATEGSYVFDLTACPLLRARLIKLGPEEHILIVIMHHIITDGWSYGVFIRELAFFYGRTAESLPDLPVQYVDYACAQAKWLHEGRFDEQVKYWRENLAGLPQLDLRCGHRTRVESERGASFTFSLQPGPTSQLRQLAQQQEITIFMALFAAFDWLLYRYTGQQDISVGTPVAGRGAPETNGLIGPFVNSVILRTQIPPHCTFLHLLQLVKKTGLEAFSNQDAPFEKVVEELNPERASSSLPLVSVFFVLHNTPLPVISLPGLKVEAWRLNDTTVKYDLLLSFREMQDQLHGTFDYKTDIFDHRAIQSMFEHLLILLKAGIHDPAQRLRDVSLLNEAEQEEILVGWNRTAAPYPFRCVHELFEEQVGRRQEEVAVEYEGETLSYGDLNRRANQLAHYLRKTGVGSEVRVGVCLERSLEMVVALLGVLKAGGAYVPLDASDPKERLDYMLRDSQVEVLIGHRELPWEQVREQVRYIDIDKHREFIAANDDVEFPSGSTPESLAYVMYTSGSTGVPKGVAVEHRSIVRLVKNANFFNLQGQETFLQFAPISFDASTFEIWGCLLNGARLVVHPRYRPSVEELGDIIERNGVTVLWLTAGLFHQMVEGPVEKLQGVRQLLAGGDVLNAAQVKRALTALPATRIINGYGPTENTTFTCCYGMEQQGLDLIEENVPIGPPISNTEVYVLDDALLPVPIGVPGELYIGGDGLARAYLNQPELTAEKFIPSAFGTVAGERLYRTGDRVRWRNNGTLEFLGRLDYQVKVRGFRIELEEIEAVLLEHEAVEQAVVVAREGADSDKKLLAYTVIREGASEVSSKEMQDYLRERLPGYMVPAAFVALKELPLTANGKVDRKALPEPDHEYTEKVEQRSPRSAGEEILCGIFAGVLKRERVGVEQNFFETGGHSLLATQVISRVRSVFGVELPLRALFEAPTAGGLAKHVNAARIGSPVVALPLVRVVRQGDLPLSYAQQRMWFLNQLQPESTAYNLAFGVRISGELDRAALQWSFNEMVLRHEVLRTTFAAKNGEPAAEIAAELKLTIGEVDLRGLQEPEGQARDVARKEAGEPFDLAQGPLLRTKLLQLDEHEHVLLITMHHIVSDGWSTGIFVREFGMLYAAFCAGKPSPLPELEIQYADFTIWQREWLQSEVLEEQLDYWRQQLAQLEPLDLPTDHARPAVMSQQGVTLNFSLKRDLSEKLRELSRQERVTLFMILLAAFQVVLSKYAGQRDVAIGTPVANRNRTEVENLIGFFVNTLVLRTDLNGNPDFRGVFKRVRQVTLDAYQHQDVPFEKLVEELQPARDLGRSPLFQVMLALQNAEQEKLQLPGLMLSPFAIESSVAKFDLLLTLREMAEGLAGEINYARDLYDAATIERLSGHLCHVFEEVVKGPGQQIGAVSLLTEPERCQVVMEWNQETTMCESCKGIHELFEEQVERSPEHSAVMYGDRSLNYRQLNERANRLGNYLRTLGVGPEVRVGICTERSPEMMIGILGVLKAGGAYVPLDPDYPAGRLNYMLQDSAPTVLLTQAHLKGLFTGFCHSMQIVELEDKIADSKASQKSAPPETAPGQLAYIIYTSGSTGMPKGVMVTHANVVRLFTATDAWFHFNANDVWTLFHSYAFDFSVWEMWGALLFGGRLIIVPQDVSRSPEDFYRLVCRTGVTILNQTPSAFRQMLTAQGHSGEAHHLRLVIFGGEALDVATLRPWYEQNEGSTTRLINMYGITETTVHVTYRELEHADVDKRGGSPIGGRIPDLKIYILDTNGEPVPIGITGELYIGGVGVARGYLKLGDLTAERFLPDPFGMEGGRLYRSGDLGRWRTDGTIEFLGRNDCQVKIRGFRIELGEIEARLVEHFGISEAVVVAREDTPGEMRLVAYYTAAEKDRGNGAHAAVSGPDGERLRSFLAERLPGYMLPAVYMQLDRMPLTTNGKLDRHALPAPYWDANPTRGYEAPQGEIETTLAVIWAEVLNVAQIGRQDNFFELGGHSLLAMTLIHRMRRANLHVDVRTLFARPVLAELAAAARNQPAVVEIPPNRIPVECAVITPEMLPLVELTREEINGIVSRVSGGAANVQDIYPLTPLQEGILFHHLMGGEGDPYLLASLVSFDSRSRLESYLASIMAVLQRHDILRTAVVWEGVREPVQVVWKTVNLPVEEIVIDAVAGDVADQLYERLDPRHHRIDVQRAPLLRLCVTYDSTHERWLVMQLLHHLVDDNTTLKALCEEIQAHQMGKPDPLPVSLSFRNLVAQSRLGVKREEYEVFFQKLLQDVTEPTAPFGLLDVQGDGSGIEETQVVLDSRLARGLRERARKLEVGPATLCHVAWALVLARVSGREDVVFGTVLFGRMQGGIDAGPAMGVFINTLPVRIQTSNGPVNKIVRQTHLQLADLMRYEHASLALVQRCSSVAAPAPLFSALLNYRHIETEVQASELTTRTWDGMEWLRVQERTNYPLTLSIDDLGEAFRLTAQCLGSIQPKRICEFMCKAIAELVQVLENAPEATVGTLDVLPEAEWKQVVEEWNETAAEYPARCMHELFEQQAEQTPDRTAVVYADQQLSYRELDRRASNLAGHLRTLGVKPEVRVGICVERGLETVIGFLGVLKAGGAYVPLDPGYPDERLRYMLKDAEVAVLLSEKGVLEQRTLGTDVKVVMLGSVSGVVGRSDQMRRREVDPGNLAYVIYTSGSTGAPKGVGITHQSATAFLHWAKEIFREGELQGMLASTSICFDLSVFEIFAPLSWGGTTLVTDNILDLTEAPWRERVRIVNTVPSAMAELIRLEGIPGLVSTVNLAGEALKQNLVKAAYEKGVERVFNLYGPTEDTTYSTYICVEREERSVSTPIGSPITNTRVYVVDGEMKPAPVGVAGELYLGGAGLARGYLGRAELTAARFVPNPFSRSGGERLYRTGDLGRWRSDGKLEFLGRVDHQVKLRGFRIELGEIEARLGELERVQEAVVVVRTEGGDQRLVAYVVGAGGEEIRPEELRRHLKERLPEYMLPSAFVVLEKIPLTPNGKLDQKNLPPPGSTNTKAYVGPRTETEKIVAGIYADVLRTPRVGAHDNFFELGGHSLLAVQVISRLRRIFEKELLLRSLFDRPTVEELAAAIESTEREKTATVIPKASRNDKLALSFAQQRLWLLESLEPGNNYVLPLVVRFQGPLNLKILRSILEEIVGRHEALRTSFFVQNGEPYQKIWPSRGVDCPLVDLSGERDHERRAQELITEEARRGFDLEQAPLMRVSLLQLGPDHHLLLLLVHHIVTDGWSLSILLRELVVLYTAYVEGKRSPLLPLELQYADYAIWQRNYLQGEVLEQQMRYWKSQLADVPELGLITDKPRPAIKDHRGSTASFAVDRKLLESLEAMARQEGATLFMITLAVYQMVLSKYSTQEDVAVGTVIANRNHIETEALVGFFVNILVIRTKVRNNQTFRELLSYVRKTTIDAYRHQDLPFEKLVEELQPQRGLHQMPLFQAMLVFQNFPQVNLKAPGLTLEVLEDKNPQVRSDLDLYIELDERTMRGRLVYDVMLFDAPTIEEMTRQFQQLLEGCVARPEARLMDLIFAEGPEFPPISQSIRQQTSAPLSYHQEKLWFVDQFETGIVYESHPVYYNIPLVLQLKGGIESGLLQQSLDVVMQRHNSLRTKIIQQNGLAAQVTVTASAVPFSIRKIEADEQSLQQDHAITCALDAIQKPFALDEAPPVRAVLYEHSNGDAVLVMVIHHILADRFSVQRIVVETAEVYSAFCEGRAVSLPDVKMQYSDYARWQRELHQKTWAPHWMYWKAQLRGDLVNLELPQICSRHPVHIYESAIYQFRISSEMAEGLKKVQEREQVSAFEVMFAGFYVLLHLYSGQEGFLVGVLDRPAQMEVANSVGPFANLFVMGGNPKDHTLGGFLAEITKSHRLGRRYSGMPFDLLVNRLKIPNDMSRTALFDVFFDCQEGPADLLQFGTAAAQVIDINLGYGKYDMNLGLRADENGWAATLVYNSKLYDRRTIEQMAAHWQGVLGFIVADTNTPVAELSLLSDAERRQQFETWNATDSDYPAAKTLCHLFEEQVRASGDRPAVNYGEKHLSYAELNHQANCLAHFLMGQGVGPDVMVGICFERSLEMVVAILAVLKAGGAYLPLDPLYPQERLNFLLDDARVKHVVTFSTFAGRFDHIQSVTLLDTDSEKIRARQSANPSHCVRPENLAYCIYTSGSTGKPNGVMVEHRQVVQLMKNDRFYFEFGPEDTWVLFHSYAFDFSVWEIWGALLYGGRLVVMDRDTVRDTASFARRLLDEKITILNQTPPSFYNLAAELLECRANVPLRYVIFGGEALQPAYLAKWKAAYPDVKLINMYGITETTVHVTFRQLDLADIEKAKSNIGIPLPATRTYILNPKMEPVPVGVPGQIYVTGEGLTRGYIGRSELTASRFLPDGMSGRPGSRVYQTGDLARYLPDGTMEYLGRIDHQVKVRGYRIELGEIENMLAAVRGVKQAAVLLRQDRDGDKQLAGYVVGDKTQKLNVDAVKNELRLHLPAYMLPEVLIELEVFPLTENGKLDRRALPAPDRKRPAKTYTAPRSATEQILCGIYEEVLGLERVGVGDDFFEIGGHSLLATKVTSRIREVLGLEMPLRLIFEGPTVRELAEKVDGQMIACGVRRTKINRVEVQDSSDLEEHLAAIEALSEEDAADFLSTVLRAPEAQS